MGDSVLQYNPLDAPVFHQLIQKRQSLFHFEPPVSYIHHLMFAEQVVENASVMLRVASLAPSTWMAERLSN